MTFERFLDEGKLKEVIVGFERDCQMKSAIGFFVFKGLDVVQILSERGMKFTDIGVCNEAFDRASRSAVQTSSVSTNLHLYPKHLGKQPFLKQIDPLQ